MASLSSATSVSNFVNEKGGNCLESIVLGGMGVGSTVLRTVISKEFCEDPHTAAYKVWEESGYLF